MSGIVIDTSVVLNWVLPDENDKPGSEARCTLYDTQRMLVVPPIFWYETRSALLAAVWRNRIDLEDARTCLELIEALPLQFGELENDDILKMAHDLGLSIYDTSYLELASRHDYALATFDKKLARCAEQMNIPLV